MCNLCIVWTNKVSGNCSLNLHELSLVAAHYSEQLKFCYGMASFCAVKSSFITFYFGILKLLKRK